MVLNKKNNFSWFKKHTTALKFFRYYKRKNKFYMNCANSLLLFIGYKIINIKHMGRIQQYNSFGK